MQVKVDLKTVGLIILQLLWVILPSAWYPWGCDVCRSLILAIASTVLLWCAYHICLNHGLLSVLCLAYPAVIYGVLFGPRAGPLTELVPAAPRRDTASSGNVAASAPLTHICSLAPSDVRTEVELHKRDFNERLKRVLFNALVVAYYSSFQPCCFVQVRASL